MRRLLRSWLRRFDEPLAPLAEEEIKRRDELVGRLFNALLGTADLYSVYIGDRLGLYRALDKGGAATPADLARRAGIDERYAREWLEQQAVTGILVCEDVAAEPRRFALPAGHAEALLDRDSASSITPVALFVPAIGAVMPRLLEAFRSGGGVAWADYGDDLWQAQGDFNRPLLRNQLAQEILPQIPDLQAVLERGALVADIACGVGWSAIAIARAYPKTRVHGFDLDERAIAQARRNAAEAGLSERATFQIKDAAEAPDAGGYDLVTFFEAVHDLSRPVEALQAARAILKPGGSVLVMDENVLETFAAPSNDVERLMYGSSILLCLPNCLAESPSAATGTVMRPATLRRYAIEAGFREVEILPIAHDLFRFYRLRP